MNGTPSYVLGVDGGNTKTDYYLYDLDGRRLGSLRTGTCSHEQFKDGYAGAKRALAEQAGELLGRHGLEPGDLAAAAFGLAGADIPSQKRELDRVIRELGYGRFEMDNDSFLGIKAGSPSGAGVCSINGTGACTGGIDPSGRRLQVGGVGSELSGDESGGAYLARRAVRLAYDELYRVGAPTALTAPALRLLGAAGPEELLERALEAMLSRSLPATELATLLLEAAAAGDGPALAAVRHSARQMAMSTAGCVRGLDFESGPVDVVLAGSVWVKAAPPILRELYMETARELLPQTELRFRLLEEPPAAGAVLWALELAHGRPASEALRARVLAGMRT